MSGALGGERPESSCSRETRGSIVPHPPHKPHRLMDVSLLRNDRPAHTPVCRPQPRRPTDPLLGVSVVCASAPTSRFPLCPMPVPSYWIRSMPRSPTGSPEFGRRGWERIRRAGAGNEHCWRGDQVQALAQERLRLGDPFILSPTVERRDLPAQQGDPAIVNGRDITKGTACQGAKTPKMMGLHQIIPTLPFLHKGGATWIRHRSVLCWSVRCGAAYPPLIHTQGARLYSEGRRFCRYVIGLSDEKAGALPA